MRNERSRSGQREKVELQLIARKTLVDPSDGPLEISHLEARGSLLYPKIDPQTAHRLL